MNLWREERSWSSAVPGCYRGPGRAAKRGRFGGGGALVSGCHCPFPHARLPATALASS